MKIARRFKNLIEGGPAHRPDYVWLAFAVCSLGEAPCGWSGWIVDAAYRRDGQRHATATGDQLLPSDDSQRCPACSGTLFRTGHDLRLEPSADQEPPLKAGVDYVPAEDIVYE